MRFFTCQPHPIQVFGTGVPPVAILENRWLRTDRSLCARAERLTDRLVTTFYAHRERLQGYVRVEGLSYAVSVRPGTPSEDNHYHVGLNVLTAQTGAFRVRVYLAA